METNLIRDSFFCEQHFKSLRLDNEMEIEPLFGKMGKQNRKRHYYPTAWDVCHSGFLMVSKEGAKVWHFDIVLLGHSYPFVPICMIDVCIFALS